MKIAFYVFALFLTLGGEHIELHEQHNAHRKTINHVAA